MKIRLSGSQDLVRDWAKVFGDAFGVSGRLFPNRDSSDVRCYIDLDDRVAEDAARRLQQGKGTVALDPPVPMDIDQVTHPRIASTDV